MFFGVAQSGLPDLYSAVNEHSLGNADSFINLNVLHIFELFFPRRCIFVCL